jgi:hypothetical protein
MADVIEEQGYFIGLNPFFTIFIQLVLNRHVVLSFPEAS